MIYFYEVTYWTRVHGVQYQQFQTPEEAAAFNLTMLNKGYRTRGVQQCIDQQSFITNPALYPYIPV